MGLTCDNLKQVLPEPQAVKFNRLCGTYSNTTQIQRNIFRQAVNRSTFLGVKSYLGQNTRFLSLSDILRFVYVRHPL
jgi:hypothetical protein